MDVERTTKRSGTVIDARMSLAMWLRAGRGQRGMSLEDVAKITKIQPRILERLEAGKFDGLPAEVFVRGFVRSFARCVGLGESEALERFNLIAMSTTKDPSPMARGLVESMSDLAPRAASRVTGPVMLVQAPADLVIPAMTVIPASSMDEVKVEDVVAASAAEPPIEARVEPPIEVVEPAIAAPAIVEASASEAPKSKKKKSRGGRKRKVANGTPFEPTPIVAAAPDDVEVTAAPVEPIAESVASEVVVAPVVEATVEPAALASVEIDVSISEPVIDSEPASSGFWAPTMPPIATTASVPWRRPNLASMTSTAALVPSLVIDDSDPDGAERVLEDRAASKISTTNAQRRSFLPPILLDRDDRSARQGGLTLAVILLLIAATITLSYLMRRPSSSGDGITQRDVPALHTIG